MSTTGKKTAPKKETVIKKSVVKKTVSEKDTAKKTTTTKKAVAPKKASVKKITPVKKTAIKKAAIKKPSSKEYEEIIEIQHKYIPDEVDIVRELPNRYNETKLTLMMRDPEWCFFYWDISDYDISYHSLNSRRISVRIFHLAMPHAYFIGELGYYDENNRFIVLARSNMIYAPRDSISNIYDEEWMVNEEIIRLLKSPKALRESLSSATIFELIDLKRTHLAGSSSSLFRRKD